MTRVPTRKCSAFPSHWFPGGRSQQAHCLNRRPCWGNVVLSSVSLSSGVSKFYPLWPASYYDTWDQHMSQRPLGSSLVTCLQTCMHVPLLSWGCTSSARVITSSLCSSAALWPAFPDASVVGTSQATVLSALSQSLVCSTFFSLFLYIHAQQHTPTCAGHLRTRCSATDQTTQLQSEDHYALILCPAAGEITGIKPMWWNQPKNTCRQHIPLRKRCNNKNQQQGRQEEQDWGFEFRS